MHDAEDLYWSGQFDSARVVFREARSAARLVADTAAEAQALTWLGLAAWRLGDHARARSLGEKALELKQVAGLDDQLWRSHNALGLLAWIESRLSDAVTHFDAAARAARASGAKRGLASVAANLALVNQDLGRFTEARRGFEVAIEAGRTLDDARIEGNAHNNLAALELLSGSPASAIAHLDTARQLYSSIDYVTGLQNALGQLSGAYIDLGDPGRGLAYLDTALVLARDQGLRQEEASNLELLADLHRDLGDTRRALQLYGEAGEINAELGLDYERGTDLRSEASIHFEVGNLSRAETRAREALRIHERIGAPFEELLDLLLLAEIEAVAAHWAQAGSDLDRARKLAGLLNARSARVELALAEARIAELRGSAPEVLAVLDAAQVDLSGARYDAQAEAYALKARAHARLDSLTEAIEAGRKAVVAVERVRQTLRSGYLRTRYLAEKSRVYGDLVGTLIAAGRQDEAFQVADAARGRAVVEHITAGRGSRTPGTGLLGEYAEGDELLLRIQELLTRLDELEETPLAERDSGEETFLMDELRRARSEYEALLVRVAETDPAGTAVLGTRPVRVTDVAEALGPDEALLEYLVAEEAVYLFLVRRDGVHSFRLDLPASEVAARVRIARELTARPERAESTPVLARLHRELVAPAVGSGLLEGIRRLVVVPHRELSYLPFAALRDPERGRYLVEDYSLLAIPNAAALPVLRARPGEPMARASLSAAGFGPFPGELPGTRSELEALRVALPEVRNRLGNGATERAVRQALEGRAVVHVASHARLNTAAPMFSRIELAPEGPGPVYDGRLEIHEVLELGVRSSLVFLSGCETGVGLAGSNRYAAGEDFVMLAQSFLYAGADNVVATLWRVEDLSAAAFATAFYGELAAADPQVALARAQRRMLEDPAYSAPFHWAGYRLTGGGGRLADHAISKGTSVSPQ